MIYMCACIDNEKPDLQGKQMKEYMIIQKEKSYQKRSQLQEGAPIK